MKSEMVWKHHHERVIMDSLIIMKMKVNYKLNASGVL